MKKAMKAVLKNKKCFKIHLFYQDVSGILLPGIRSIDHERFMSKVILMCHVHQTEIRHCHSSKPLQFAENPNLWWCLPRSEPVLLVGLALFHEISPPCEIPCKICFRLHEKRASSPKRDLVIDYPRSRLGGLEIFHTQQKH